MIKSDVVSEDDDGPEARGPLRRQNEDLDEASRPTARAAPAEGGKPGPGAQAHALFASRGGNQKKFEVYKMPATSKMCLKRSPGADFEEGSFQRGKNVAPTATRALF